MNHVKKITFKKDWRCYKAGWNFEPLPGINLLVGDQGCGKSTLLEALGKNDQEKIQIDLENYELVETHYLDTEKHNPRMVAHLDMTHMATGLVLSSRFGSHGESMLPLMSSCKEGKDAIFFIDEPESGLSIRSQYEVVRAIHTAAKNGCQLFIATHCVTLIETQPTVFSLEHNRWMPSEEFLESQKGPKSPKVEAKQEPEKKGLLHKKLQKINRH